MLRFLYGLICLVCLVIVAGSLAGWACSDRIETAAPVGKTYATRHHQFEGRHARGQATLVVTPGERHDDGTFVPVPDATAATQPAAQSWSFQQAAFSATPTSGGRLYYFTAPYWLIAAAFSVPLLIWMALPKRHNPRACRNCKGDLKGSPATCKHCGQTFTVAQY
jgi:hypothetical protein